MEVAALSNPSILPDLAKASSLFSQFCKVIAHLRDPVHGCPWDLEQTHRSLASFMLEEAYEASAVMSEGDFNQVAPRQELCDELGDVLLQVLLHAQIAFEAGHFSIHDVVESITHKMIRRHPHVFGSPSERDQRGIDQVKRNWLDVKAKEKNTQGLESGHMFAKAAVHKVTPATIQGFKIGKLSKQMGFDFPHAKQAFKKLKEEIAECEVAWDSDPKHLETELSDVYFSLAQVCRLLNLDPEQVAMGGNRKFLTRFDQVYELAKAQPGGWDALDGVAKEALWQRAKQTV